MQCRDHARRGWLLPVAILALAMPGIGQAQVFPNILPPKPLATATVGKPYRVDFTSDQDVNWTSETPPPGLTFQATGPRTATLSGTPTTDGTFSFHVTGTASKPDSQGGFPSTTVNYDVVVVKTAPLSLACPATTGQVGVPYSSKWVASGGVPPYTYNVIVGSGFDGISLDGVTSTTGNFSGTPTTAGTFTFAIYAADSAGQIVTTNCTFVIAPASSTFRITTQPPLPNATVGLPYQTTIQSNGGAPPLVWSVTGPQNVTIGPGTGILAFTPVAPGTINVTVGAKDNNGQTATPVTYPITINPAGTPAPLTLAPVTLPSVTAKTPFNFTVTAGGGMSPYNFIILGGSPFDPARPVTPIWVNLLQISPTMATLTGTPPDAGQFPVNIQITDSQQFTFTKLFTLNVLPAGPSGLSMSYPLLSGVTLGTPFTINPTISGTTSPDYRFSVTPGSTLPGGITLNPATGMLSGAFTTPWNNSFNIQVMNGSQTATQAFNVFVPPGLDSQFTASRATADPVATATGELYDWALDIRLGGPLPVVFERYYSTLLRPNGVSSALGSNWMHNFEVKLAATGSDATVTLMAGKVVRFKQAGVAWNLQAPAQFVYQLATLPGGGYRFLDPASRLIYTFSNSGALTRIEDRNGNALTVTQGGNGPTDVSDGLGRSLHFTYTAGQLTGVADQTGRAISFSYAGDDLTAFTDANGIKTSYSYTTAGPLKSLLSAKTMPSGNRPYSQIYNDLGQVSKQSDSLGNPTTLVYDARSQITTVTDPRGNQETHTNQGFNRIAKQADATSQNTQFTYDDNIRLTSITDRLGNTSGAVYHAPSGYVASRTDAPGNTTSYVYAAQTQGSFTFYNLTRIAFADGTFAAFSYDNSGNALSATDQAGKVTNYTYNSRGQTLTSTNPAGGVTTVTYNTDGTIATVKGPAGNLTSYGYDDKKRLSQVQFADNTLRSFTYDALDQLLTATDERGKVTKFAYDANGNLKSVTDPLSQTVTASYDNDDLVSSITDQLGNTGTLQYDEVGSLTASINAAGEKISRTYDALNRLKSVADPSGKGPSFTYDADGNLVATADALSNAVAFTIDPLGRATRATTPLGENYDRTFDALGRVTSASNPLSQVTAFSYDSRGRLNSVTAPGGVTASFTRDDLGSLTGVTDSNGNIWTRKYDSARRILSRTDPLGRTTSYSYDARNRLSGVVNPEGSLQISYDAAGNETSRQYSDGTLQSFTYDDSNRPISGRGLALAYDAAGRLVASNGLTIARDAIGRITGVTYAPGKTVGYTYNSRGLLAKVSDWAGGSVSLTYDDAARVVSMARSNGVATQFSYDKNSRVAGITEAAGDQTLASIALQRDAAGKVTSADRNLPQAPTLAPGVLPLGYDVAHQISGATYDGLGRITSDSLRTYTWNLSSELTAYSGADGSASFGYDAFGLRTSRMAADGTTRNYVLNYALGLPSIATVQTSGVDLRYYVYLPDGSLLYSIEAADNTRHFYHFDEAGSTTYLTGDSGAITDSYGITPYGEDVTQTGSADNPFTFMGRWGVMQEAGTSLYFMRYRYYDSAPARFLSRDPVLSLDPREINPYQYVSANPVGKVDPMGLKGQNNQYFPYIQKMVELGVTKGYNYVPAGTATVNMGYAPVSADASASSSLSIPRFAESPVSVVVVNPLSPDVNNTFDTGLAIGNTSMEPFATTPMVNSGPAPSPALQPVVSALSTSFLTAGAANAIADNQALNLYVDTMTSLQRPLKTFSNALSDPNSGPSPSPALQPVVSALSTSILTAGAANAIADNQALNLYVDTLTSLQKPVNTVSNALNDLSNRPSTGSMTSPGTTLSRAFRDLFGGP